MPSVRDMQVVPRLSDGWSTLVMERCRYDIGPVRTSRRPPIRSPAVKIRPSPTRPRPLTGYQPTVPRGTDDITWFSCLISRRSRSGMVAARLEPTSRCAPKRLGYLKISAPAVMEREAFAPGRS